MNIKTTVTLKKDEIDVLMTVADLLEELETELTNFFEHDGIDAFLAELLTARTRNKKKFDWELGDYSNIDIDISDYYTSPQ